MVLSLISNSPVCSIMKLMRTCLSLSTREDKFVLQLNFILSLSIKDKSFLIQPYGTLSLPPASNISDASFLADLKNFVS